MTNLKGTLLGIAAGFALALVAVYGYSIMTINGTATGVEGIEADKLSFSLSFYPNETKTEVITFTNLGSADIDIDLDELVSGPDPRTITVTVPKNLTVPANGTNTADIEMTAKNNLEPGEYNIDIAVTR